MNLIALIKNHLVFLTKDNEDKRLDNLQCWYNQNDYPNMDAYEVYVEQIKQQRIPVPEYNYSYEENNNNNNCFYN